MALVMGSVAACGTTPTNPTEDGGLDGRYRYAAYDSAGAQLLSGELVLALQPDSSVEGTWEFDWVPGADTLRAVGPQVGTGTLTGTFHAGELRADLNPGWADNNVFLVGTMNTMGPLPRIVGTWGHSTFIGQVAWGFFDAERLPPP